MKQFRVFLRALGLAGGAATLAVALAGCYVGPYPYRGAAFVGPPVVVVRPHPCWRCW